MPRQYRKKPVVIEAMQFTSNNEADSANINAVVVWIHSFGANAKHDETFIYIETLEGLMKANVGDYIIKGVNNEFYPCKPDIFVKTYDEVSPNKETIK